MLTVWEMRIGPIMYLAMHLRILGIARVYVRHEGRNDSLIVRPPELHEMPVLLNRLTHEICEIKNAAVLLIPTALPHPIEHL